MPSKFKLFDAILDAKWKNVPTYLHEARNLDDDGSTALHYACNNNAPLNVIEMLLTNFPEAAFLQDKWGQTPLYRSVYWNSAETVDLLMKCAPNSASIPNTLGETPLHIALEYRYSPRLTQTLVQTYPLLIQIKNRYSITPLAAFFSKWELSIADILASTSYTASPSHILNRIIPKSSNSRIVSVIKIHHLVQYLYILLRAACPPRTDTAVGDEHHSAWFSLHASILVPTCPWPIRYLMLRVHPEQITLKDSHGNLPVVLLATMSNNTNNNDHDDQQQQTQAHDDASLLILSMIFQMLRECPTLISNTLRYTPSITKRRKNYHSFL